MLLKNVTCNFKVTESFVNENWMYTYAVAANQKCRLQLGKLTFLSYLQVVFM